MSINKKELKYIIFAGIFALLWFMYILPYLIEKFDGNNPWMQFMLFNAGLIILLQIFLKAFILNTKIRIELSLGLIFSFIALDILQPPYAILKTGELISTGPLLMISSSDYIAGLLWQNIGLSGVLIYLATYVVTPILLLIIAAKLIPNFVRHV